MDQNKVDSWGYVSSGARVTDKSTGEVYVADNQHGWVLLVARPADNSLKFEALDAIDHERFQIQQP